MSEILHEAPPTVALMIETKSRELDGKLLLAQKLLNFGFEVMIGPADAFFRQLFLEDIQILLAISIGGDYNRQVLYRQLKSRNCKIFALDGEGGIISSPEFYAKNRVGKSIQTYFDAYFAWGNSSYSALKEFTEFPNERILISGEPKYDLLSANICLSPDEALKIRGKYGKFILINTNFGGFNHASRKARKQLETTDKIDRSESVKENFLVRRDAQEYLIKEFCELIEYLSEKFEGLNFIIRPHPSEDIDYYSFLTTRKNIFCVREFSVFPFIQECVCVLHNNCTTGVEGVIAKKPVIEFVPKELPAYDLSAPRSVSHVANSKAEVFVAINQLLIDPKPFPENQISKQVLETFGKLDGGSSDLIAKSMMEVKSRSVDTAQTNFAASILYIKRLMIAHLERITYCLLPNSFSTFLRTAYYTVLGRREQLEYVKQKFPYLTVSEVQAKLRVLDASGKYQVKKSKHIHETVIVRKLY